MLVSPTTTRDGAPPKTQGAPGRVVGSEKEEVGRHGRDGCPVVHVEYRAFHPIIESQWIRNKFRLQQTYSKTESFECESRPSESGPQIQCVKHGFQHKFRKNNFR